MTAAETLARRGFVLLPSVVSAPECAAYLEAVDASWRELGEPALHSQEDLAVGPNATVSPVGLVLADFLHRHAWAHELLLPPAVRDIASSVLGGDFVLERGAAVLSDHSRPFFFWHHHLLGMMNARDYRALDVRYPVYDVITRLSCTFYPVPLDEERGEMLVMPHRLGEPTAPAYEAMDAEWPGQETVTCPAGSVLVMEQSVWHAVRAMKQPGRRSFLGGFLAQASSA